MKFFAILALLGVYTQSAIATKAFLNEDLATLQLAQTNVGVEARKLTGKEP